MALGTRTSSLKSINFNFSNSILRRNIDYTQTETGNGIASLSPYAFYVSLNERALSIEVSRSSFKNKTPKLVSIFPFLFVLCFAAETIFVSSTRWCSSERKLKFWRRRNGSWNRSRVYNDKETVKDLDCSAVTNVSQVVLPFHWTDFWRKEQFALRCFWPLNVYFLFHFIFVLGRKHPCTRWKRMLACYKLQN